MQKQPGNGVKTSTFSPIAKCFPIACPAGMFLIAALAALILSCAPGVKRQTSRDAPKVTSIRVYSWDNEYAIKAVTDRFNASSKAVRVELVQIPWRDYQSRLFVALSNHENIDVYFMREMEAFAGYVRKGLAYPLDDMIAEHKIDLAAYGSVIDQSKADGKIYALPYRGAGYYLFYNKKAFRDARIPSPGNTWSWEEYRKAAKRLTKGAGINKQYGSFMEPSMYQLPLLPALQAGVRIVDDEYRTDFDNPAVRRALLYYQTLTDRDRSQPTQAEMKANNMTTTAMFVTGKAMMTIAGEWLVGRLNAAKAAGELKFDWGIARIPYDTKNYAGSGLATKGCLSASTEKAEAAFSYLSWVAGIEGQKVIAEAGSKPALVTPETEEILANCMGLDEQERRIFFEVPERMANQPINLGATYAKQILEEELSAFYSGGRSVDDTISRCTARLDLALAEFRQAR